jgi:hypothetical protein
MVRCAIFSIVLIVAVGPVLAQQPNSRVRLLRPRHRNRRVLRQLPTLLWLQ